MQDTSASKYIDVTSKPPASAGNWMTLQAASNTTGLSLATLRRYIKKRIIKGRRLGKTSNAKVEVFVTPEFMNAGEAERLDVDGFEEVLDANAEDSLEDVDVADQAAQATVETLEWMRETIDDKEAKIEQLAQQIDTLNKQLTAASYRNGYLEAQQKGFEDQVKLLTDRTAPPQKSGWLAQIRAWFTQAK